MVASIVGGSPHRDGAPVLVGLVCVAVFFLFSHPDPMGGLSDAAREWGALQLGELLAGERLWTALTSGLLHGDLWHLAGNVAGLATLGLFVDLRVGRALTFVIMVVGTAGGAVAWALLATPVSGVDTYSVGISDAVCALAGAELTLVIGLHRRVKVPQQIWRSLIGYSLDISTLPEWLLELTFFVLFLVYQPLITPNVSWEAHLGGFIAGVVVALPMRWLPPPKDYVAWYFLVEPSGEIETATGSE